MVSAVLVAGVLVAVFVGYNIGSSSTGVAVGPAVGSRITGKTLAAVLFTGFALLGGWTVVLQRLLGGRIEHRECGRAFSGQRRDRGRSGHAARGRRNASRGPETSQCQG